MKYKMSLSIIFLFVFLFSACEDATEPPKEVAQSKISTAANTEVEETISPLYISRDYGGSWEAIGKGLPAEIQISVLGSLEDQLIVTTNNQGIFMAKEGTEDWQQIGEDLPKKRVNELYISGTEIYAGIYQNGIYKSVDKGKNWVSLNFDLPDLRVQSIVKIGDKLLVGTDAGIFKYQDKAEKWEKVFSDVQASSLHEYYGKLVAGTHKGVLLSRDEGVSWEWIHQEGAAHNTTILNGRIVSINNPSSFHFSDDWGKTWNETFHLSKANSSIFKIGQLHKSLIMSNYLGIHRSFDDGMTWQLTAENTDKQFFFNFLVVGNLIYVGNGGGAC